MDLTLFIIYFIFWIIVNTIESFRKISAIIGLFLLMGIFLKYMVFVPTLYNTGDVSLCANLITSLIYDFVQWALPPWAGFFIGSALSGNYNNIQQII
ncbi:hypothetical protein [Methanotorris igneus]|uniref:Uncharacterized protein n=1 Tax=Methanotorris igneus (strain DSM 5666 / JCM 11834 / Kol 5) TaxID=880724 RepID=F6BCT4_METIK|nr:hypothetical protein [Methanotorris igneus]AEF96295.1 hypothetical protein Metig_0747 [Methanotorris igneus Kol 5]